MSAATAVPEDVGAVVEEVVREGRPLAVTANLSVTVEGVDLAVSTVDDRIRVQVPSVRALLMVARAADGDDVDLPRTLAAAGLTAEIRVGAAVVAVAGAEATADRLARVLSLGPVELRERALAAAALRLR